MVDATDNNFQEAYAGGFFMLKGSAEWPRPRAQRADKDETISLK